MVEAYEASQKHRDMGRGTPERGTSSHPIPSHPTRGLLEEGPQPAEKSSCWPIPVKSQAHWSLYTTPGGVGAMP